jgi:H+/Cl- antiporter ClcA
MSSSFSGVTERGSSPWWRLVFATIVTGIGAGLGGMALSLLLHAVQHLAYGYSEGRLIGPETFIEGVAAASRERRLLVLSICGLVAGLGWWALDRYARPRVDLSKAVQPGGPRMPIVTTIVHALLQIVTVALGSPLGREVAPREIGATFASWLSRRVGLSAEEGRVLLACGAGAGLAAVYDVPLAGGVFTLEVMLATFAWRASLPALATSVIAATVASIGLGNDAQYRVPAFEVDASLIVWSIVAGPLIGVAAFGFRRACALARTPSTMRGWRRALLCVVVFVAIGWLAGWYPQILGNGKGPAQLGFDGELATGDALVVLALKVVVVTAALRAGAHGGVLTPGLSCGALLAIALGAAWSALWPGPASGAYALVGAAAFLSASMAMPLTAILLVFEFTRIGHDFVVPILFAVAGSLGMARLCANAAR